MTKEELCIHACKYAISELTRKGSTGFIASSHEGGQQITWVEVMEWLSREQCKDAISREDAIMCMTGEYVADMTYKPEDIISKHIRRLRALPSVQPKYNTSDEKIKQPKIGYCKDCKYFEYDHFENMGGIPLITAHKVCIRHGLICKTDEDGYCHLWEHKAESDE